MAKEKSVVIEAPYELVLGEFDLPEIGPDEALLRVEMVSVCGSDPKPYVGEDVLGTRHPIIPGHEVVGHIAAIGQEAARAYGVKECADPPHLWGAYGQHMHIAPNSRLHRVATDVPAEAACLSSVIGNGIRWVSSKAKVQLGETVMIIGPGSQGLATTIAAKEAGANPIIIAGLSRDERRMALAKEFGADYTIDVEKENLVSAVSHITEGKMADVVVTCTGNPDSIKVGLELVKPLGAM